MVERPTSHAKGARNARALIHGACFPWTNRMSLSSPTCGPACGGASQQTGPPSFRECGTQLQKPNGGVRGIVAGDIFRRPAARTTAQQLSRAVEADTARFKTRCKREWPMRCKVISELCTIGTDVAYGARDVASGPLSLGGLGLRSTVRTSQPAFWASWADCFSIRTAPSGC